MTAIDFFFILFSLLIVLSLFGVSFFKNSVYVISSAAVTFLAGAAVFVLLEADYVAIMQIFISVAGITGLMLFSTVLSNKRYSLGWSLPHGQILVPLIVSLFLFISLCFVILSVQWETASIAHASRTTVSRIGDLLSEEFIVPMVISIFITLVSIAGALEFLKRLGSERHG